MGLEEARRISLARNVSEMGGDLVSREILEEGRPDAWAERGDFPRAYREDFELKVGLLWESGTKSPGWRDKNLGWKARASVD